LPEVASFFIWKKVLKGKSENIETTKKYKRIIFIWDNELNLPDKIVSPSPSPFRTIPSALETPRKDAQKLTLQRKFTRFCIKVEPPPPGILKHYSPVATL
jgi:hypothetical protein